MKAFYGFDAADGFLLCLEQKRSAFFLKICATGKEENKILCTEMCRCHVQQWHFSASLLLQTPPSSK